MTTQARERYTFLCDDMEFDLSSRRCEPPRTLADSDRSYRYSSNTTSGSSSTTTTTSTSASITSTTTTTTPTSMAHAAETPPPLLLAKGRTPITNKNTKTDTPVHTHIQEPVSRLVSAYNHCKDQHQMDPICAWERPKKKNTGAFDDLSTITNSLSAYNHCKDQHQMDPICAWERPKQNNRAICQSKRENSFIHKTIRESID